MQHSSRWLFGFVLKYAGVWVPFMIGSLVLAALGGWTLAGWFLFISIAFVGLSFLWFHALRVLEAKAKRLMDEGKTEVPEVPKVDRAV